MKSHRNSERRENIPKLRQIMPLDLEELIPERANFSNASCGDADQHHRYEKREKIAGTVRVSDRGLCQGVRSSGHLSGAQVRARRSLAANGTAGWEYGCGDQQEDREATRHLLPGCGCSCRAGGAAKSEIIILELWWQTAARRNPSDLHLMAPRPTARGATVAGIRTAGIMCR